MAKEKIRILDSDFNEPPKEPVKSAPRLSKKVYLIIVLVSLIGGLLGGGLTSRVIIPYITSKLQKEGKIEIPAEKVEKVKVEEESAIIEAVDKVKESVVSIVSETAIRDIFGSITTEKSGGTGFVLTSDGYIVTNKHVISDKRTKYTVITYDGKNYEAEVVAHDPLNDLGVLKIKANGLKAVDIGSSSDLKVGQRVIAIGNALGEFQNTVTVGVVSAKGRAITASDALGSKERLENLIQTDAAINPGNSGGPLINLRGQVVGINTAMAEAQNIGFAIAIEVLKPVDQFIKNLREKGKIVRPMIGIRYLPITKDIASLNNLPVDYGALVLQGQYGEPAVIPGGPADRAGLEAGDIILTIGGDKIDENHSLSLLIQKYQPGNTLELKIMRQGKEKIVQVILDEFK